MHESLSLTQKKIALEQKGLFVVRACPGSGKTYCVAARLSDQLSKWKSRNQGIATLSFTNVAWQEIQKTAESKFNCAHAHNYPHFIGTIDSFINNYIFLPFGHLVLNCSNRPILVGEPHGEWTLKRWQNDYAQYFHLVSLDIDDSLIYPEKQGVFHFKYSQIYKKDGTESGHADNLRKIKTELWSQGYASQQDANYFTFKILSKYPNIAKAIAHRFPKFIVDEAQDTNRVQMGIIDLLIKAGLKEIVLVGDPDQAIYEWNNAKPELFNQKFEEWRGNSIVMNENRRSSQKICDFTFPLSTLPTISFSVGDSASSVTQPEITEYTKETIKSTIDGFIAECKRNEIEITPAKVAIAFRSNSFMDDIFGEVNHGLEIWKENDFLSKDFAYGKFLFDSGEIKQGFKRLERAILKMQLNKAMINSGDIRNRIEEVGIFSHRNDIYNVLKGLPATDRTLAEWVNESNLALEAIGHNKVIAYQDGVGHLPINNLFAPPIRNTQEYSDVRFGTVHSMKGETFDAILMFLRTKDGRNYSSYLKENVTLDQSEALRIVYVGITRPRLLLQIAVPNEKELKAWRLKLNPTSGHDTFEPLI